MSETFKSLKIKCKGNIKITEYTFSDEVISTENLN